jgi:hypothetical protein
MLREKSEPQIPPHGMKRLIGMTIWSDDNKRKLLAARLKPALTQTFMRNGDKIVPRDIKKQVQNWRVTKPSVSVNTVHTPISLSESSASCVL